MAQPGRSVSGLRGCSRSQGRYFDADPSDDALARDHPLLAACYVASLWGHIAAGPQAGQRVLRLGRRDDHEEWGGGDEARTPGHGFNLHAAMRVSADDRKGRERLLRYILRPPTATRRLTRGDDPPSDRQRLGESTLRCERRVPVLKTEG